MARTISPDYDKRRATILAKAAQLYARNGFLGASIADLAKACKSSKSLVYHYYASKEDILYGVMSAHLDELSEISAQVTAGDGLTPEQKLSALTHGFMNRYVGAAASHKVLLNELDNLPADKRRKIVAQQLEIISGVEQLVRQIRPDLPTDAGLTRALTMLFFGMINWTHTWFDPTGSLSVDGFAELTVRVLLDGLRSPAIAA